MNIYGVERLAADMTDSDVVAEMVPEQLTVETSASSHSGNPGGGSADMTAAPT